MTSGSERFSIHPLGEHAALVNFEQRIDPAINARVYQLEAWLLQKADHLIAFTVPAYCSLAVGFDPARSGQLTSVEILTELLESLVYAEEAVTSGQVWTIPVCYCSECGPDLGEVARQTKLNIEVVIERHHCREYRAYMLGFLPGFAYLGKLDRSIAVSRKTQPRFNVPAGSVGLAGEQTGVYPFTSPGGWQIIGRTPESMTREDGNPFFRLNPGDQVRFHPIDHMEFERLSAEMGQAEKENQMHDFEVVDPDQYPIEILGAGMWTTIQDLGRIGYQRYGVPVAGAMDRVAAINANRLLGMPDNAAVLEMTLQGPDIRFDADCQLAMTGAKFQPRLNGADMAMNQVHSISAGDHLRTGWAQQGCRGYLAIGRGIGSVNWLNSVSCSGVNRQQWTPRAKIETGDRLGPGKLPQQARQRLLPGFEITATPTIRLVPGPEFDWLDEARQAELFQSAWTISADANRMGYRLRESLGTVASESLISSAVVPGTIQLTPDGKLIILMRDCQTTGGYPRIGVVKEYDLNRLAQLRPGDRLRFRMATSFFRTSPGT